MRSAIPQTPAPPVIPVFPLTGSLLLPGTLLPLNIFEPRYRNMVADALEEGMHIGMIQPVVPRLDNFGSLLDPTDLEQAPELYHVGCVGRIDRSEAQPDGRYEIVLRGVCRFRIREELPEQNGYRRVSADYGEFLADLAEPQSVLDPSRMLASLRAFGEKHGLEFDYALLGDLPGISLLNGLAVALPFRPRGEAGAAGGGRSGGKRTAPPDVDGDGDRAAVERRVLLPSDRQLTGPPAPRSQPSPTRSTAISEASRPPTSAPWSAPTAAASIRGRWSRRSSPGT